MSKTRITVTLDADLVDAANAAVAEGRARSVSAWVSEAMSWHSERARHIAAIEEAVAAYEAGFGDITEEDMAERRRLDQETAAKVRAGRSERERRRRARAS